MQCHVNLIPLNTVKERNLYGVTEKQVQAFLAVLEKRHISATRRREMGDDIEGACGQLRKSIIWRTAMKWYFQNACGPCAGSRTRIPCCVRRANGLYRRGGRHGRP